MRLILLISLLLTSSTAQAQEKATGDPTDQVAPAHQLKDSHYLGAYFTGLASGAVLATAGGYIAYETRPPCVDEEPDQHSEGYGLGCNGEAAALAFIGGGAGMSLGVSLGVYAYGNMTGHKGSLGSTFYGSGLTFIGGLALTLLTIPATESVNLVVDLLAITLVVMPVGAIVGYNARSEHCFGCIGPPLDVPPPTALIDLSPATGVRLGPPNLRWSRRGQDSRWSFSLLGGRF